ncbi:carbohydrate deacetylase [Clostridium sp. LIBA-8841]|uniref:carbohydrate deacetylase n=1 Tax=Clostridium sp. LIBA-8841 TaxID=2987530 RepID=UPI002AC4D2D8|nr:ChbG/HpnK family deacetylase [Clostridium sp. LIBA-8841]MDZ5254375.1 ChbG/HpnK family deacetylase [Clostridium sp. LIBA-8841]
MKKYLIINADDFGLSNSINEAIINLLNENRISSATLMPNVASYDQAASWSKNNSNSIGLHLTLVNGGSNKKFNSLTRKASLEDDSGYLFEDKFYFMKNFKYKELKKEIDMQFKKIVNDGIKISHVDTHRYAIYPTHNPLAYIYLCKKCKEYKVATRWCRRGPYFVGEKISNLCDSYPASQFFASIADIYNVPIPDYVFKFPYKDLLIDYEEKKKGFIEMLSKLPNGISEVHIHPSVDDRDIREITETYEERIHEYNLLLDKDVIDAIGKFGINIIKYSDISSIIKPQNKLKSFFNIIRYGSNYAFKILYKKIRIS